MKVHRKILGILTVVVIPLFAITAESQAPSPAVSTASGSRGQTGNVPSSGKVDTTTGAVAGRYRISNEQEYSGRFEEARQKAAIGNYAEAITGFQDVADRAHQLNDSDTEAESSLRLARAIELSGSKGTLDDASFAQAKLAYDRAIQFGNPGQQASARNGLASMLLRRGDPAGAVTQLRAIDLAKVDASHRAVYRYNLGLANEKSGNWAEAYSSYLGAIGDKPEYGSAAQATFALLQRSTQPRISEAVQFNNSLLSTGQISSAGGYTKQLLERWAGKPDSQRLLAALLQYYSVSPLTLDDLREREWPYLQQIASSAPELAEPIRDIQVACFGSFPPMFEHYQALDFFRGWAGGDWQQAAMGQMLKRAGDEFKQSGKFQDALSRYAAAWALSFDADAALYAASVLHDHRQFIDSNERLFDQLLNGIIEVKGMDYSKLDWPNILRMHTLLGTIFEQEKHWGSETELRSAIFQWNRAIYAEAQIRHSNPQYPPSPELYMKLANAYQQTGNSKALELYLTAAQAFADTGNVKQARSALAAAGSLNGSKAPSVQQRMDGIVAEIKKEES
jgi:hypothetical protein